MSGPGAGASLLERLPGGGGRSTGVRASAQRLGLPGSWWLFLHGSRGLFWPVCVLCIVPDIWTPGLREKRIYIHGGEGECIRELSIGLNRPWGCKCFGISVWPCMYRGAGGLCEWPVCM